ncbi:MAG: HD domain-containing protein [Candidatus Thermoplasmatota archaeon]|nr:HD domain-containing protein [Candidatus Thermoplasmatota archaeon]
MKEEPNSVIELIGVINDYFLESYPDFTDGHSESHPILPPKNSKIIHDSLWGTNRFEWYEMSVIDSPILQRLRDIKQVGSASLIYPSATHSRFEHSLGTSIIASRVFDSLIARERKTLKMIVNSIDSSSDYYIVIEKMKQELRLASILHDSGHTLYSHTSESTHSQIDLLKKATNELSDFVGKERSTGETLSYSIARSEFLKSLIERYNNSIPENIKHKYTPFRADLGNVALMIVGKTKNPYTQFLADILTSGFDADKLDYLLRDGASAGLPVRYDLDRYLEFVSLDDSTTIIHKKNELKVIENVYGEKKDIGQKLDEYRLRLPQNAITSLEQIIIGKFMLFGYIYHHPKVRAADSYIEKTLNTAVSGFKNKKIPDQKIIKWLFGLTDSFFNAIAMKNFENETEFFDEELKTCAYRIMNRTLPREILRLNGSTVTHAAQDNVINFLINLQDPEKKKEEIEKIEGDLKSLIGEESLSVWLDVPKPPSFDDVTKSVGNVPFLNLFPIAQWIDSYMAYTYNVRVFTFSHLANKVREALLRYFPEKLGVSEDVVEKFMKNRDV